MDCGVLADIPNGEVTLDSGTTTFGSTATYECEDGYFLDVGSSASRVCEATAEWEPEEPVCSRKYGVYVCVCVVYVCVCMYTMCVHSVCMFVCTYVCA